MSAQFSQSILRTLCGCLAALVCSLLGFSSASAAECGTLPKDVAGQVTLQAGCVYAGPIQITTSGTTLDCNGSVLEGRGQAPATGIAIDSKGQELRDVTVRNCTIQNFRSGVRVTWSAEDSAKGTDHEEIYRRTPQRVRLEKLIVRSSERVGIYIDDYVRDATIIDSVIEGSGAVGMYLEHSSRGNRVVGNRFVNNGKALRREALAIDSSAHNVVENNVFSGNFAGGIFLYKNCGEHLSGAQADPGGVIRWQHSNHNIIRNNVFRDEKVGVWLASRQSRNLKSMSCGDRPLDPEKRFFQDYADDNVLEQNLFCSTPVPVRNEGDRNRIVGNRFDGATASMVDMPSTMLAELTGHVQSGTVVSDNVKASCPAQ